MTIGPVTHSHREISVTEPVSPALERVKTMLFKPFDLGKWFTIGFCAWLAALGEGGGSGMNFNNTFGNKTGSNSSDPAGESLRLSPGAGLCVGQSGLDHTAGGGGGGIAAGVVDFDFMVEQPGQVHVPALRDAGQGGGGRAVA